MIPSDHFVRFYNEVFKALEARGREHLVAFWRELGRLQAIELADTFRAGGLAACHAYWSRIVQEENCEADLTLTADYFEFRMRRCPSLMKAMDNDASPHAYYCDHCMAWIEPVMEAAGLHAAYDIESRTEPHCVFRIYKDHEQARAFEQQARLPARPYAPVATERPGAGSVATGMGPLPTFAISQRTPQPLLKSEMPWENRYMNFFNVIRDAKGWHMWYHSYDQSYKDDNDAYLCYAFSRDGMAWIRPELGLVEYAGSKKNNILIGGRATGGMHGGTVFLDPQAPAAERYKLVFSRGETIDGHLTWVVRGAVSADGLRWQILSEPLLKKNSDTQTVCFRDGDLYRLYTRMWSGSHFSGKRMVGYTESRTFGAFPAPEPILAPAPEDPDDLHFYNSAATKLRDDLYVIFSSAFFTGDQTVRPYLAASRDGRYFDRVGNREFVALGAEGAFDSRSIYVVPGAVPGDKPGTWWMYYIGLAIGHDGKPDRAGAYGRFLLAVSRPHGGPGENRLVTSGECVGA